MSRINFASRVLGWAKSALEPGASEAERTFAARAVVAVLPRVGEQHVRDALQIIASAPPATMGPEVAAALAKYTSGDPDLARAVDAVVAPIEAARAARWARYRRP